MSNVLEYLKNLQKRQLLPFSAENFEILTEKGQHYVVRTSDSKLNQNYILRIPKSTDNTQILDDLEHESAVTNILSQYDLGVPISNVHMYAGEQPFAYHQEVKGTLLTENVYSQLSENHKEFLAKNFASFFNKLHSIPIEKFNHITSQSASKSIDNNFLKNEFNYPLAKKLLKKYGINLDTFKTDIKEDRVFCHNDLHGENITINFQDNKDIPNKQILGGVFDFGNADIANRNFDFIKLINLDRNLARKTIQQYNEMSPHKANLKEADYLYLCWQAQNLIIYTMAKANIEKNKKNKTISQQEYDSFINKYNNFEKLTKHKLSSFRLDVAKERTESKCTDKNTLKTYNNNNRSATSNISLQNSR